nr:hypothetical protein [uncultured Desulfobacter sp.]
MSNYSIQAVEYGVEMAESVNAELVIVNVINQRDLRLSWEIRSSYPPPKHGALLYAPLLEAFCQIFPKGVINIIYGEGRRLIPPLMASRKINVLGLIGTSKTANAL